MNRLKIVAALFGILPLSACSDSSSDDVAPGAAAAVSTPLPEFNKKPDGTVEDRIAKAEEFEKAGDLVKAISELDEATLIDATHRKLLFLLAKYSRSRSIAVAEKEPAQAYRYMVSSGAYLREFLDRHKDLTEDEKKLVVDVLYDEASAHAKSMRLEETQGALNEAIGAGFKDFDRLRKDPSWKGMLELSMFQKAFPKVVGKE